MSMTPVTLRKAYWKKINSQTARIESGCLSSPKHASCSSLQIRKLGVCFLILYYQILLTKPESLSLGVTHRTNTFRKLGFFPIALGVKLLCCNYQATKFHFFLTILELIIFFKIAQNVILPTGCAVETEPFPSLFSSFWVPFWKFPVFGNFWVWQNYNVKIKNKRQGAKPAIFTLMGNLGGAPSALLGGIYPGGVVLCPCLRTKCCLSIVHFVLLVDA